MFFQGLTSTIRHELLHALGFSASLYAFFRDENGQPRTPRDEIGKPPIDFDLRVRKWSENTIIKTTRPWKVRGGFLNKTVNLMVTPRVLQEVRDHFGCPDLEGAELEDQGGDGTAITHWEKRIFQDEAMTGTVHTKDPAYSRLTFALLEDTGWYMPNYQYVSTNIYYLKWLRMKFRSFLFRIQNSNGWYRQIPILKAKLEYFSKDFELKARIVGIKSSSATIQDIFLELAEMKLSLNLLVFSLKRGSLGTGSSAFGSNTSSGLGVGSSKVSI